MEIGFLAMASKLEGFGHLCDPRASLPRPDTTSNVAACFLSSAACLMDIYPLCSHNAIEEEEEEPRRSLAIKTFSLFGLVFAGRKSVSTQLHFQGNKRVNPQLRKRASVPCC